MTTLDYPHITTANGDAAALGYGWSAEEIARQYPHLTLAEIHAALGDYYDHREEIDAKLADELTELDRTSVRPASSLRLRLIATRQNQAA